MRLKMDTPTRFNKYVMPTPSGCMVWTGAKLKDGYGQFRLDGRTVQSHRYAYEQRHGKIPAGLVLDHLCRVPACVNVAHLEAVTSRENVVVRGFTVTGRNVKKEQCIHGHGPFDYFYANKRGCKTCRALAKVRHRRNTLR